MAVALLLAAPASTPAQNSGDAGVSGIPKGPGSVGGLNNSINDPSGIGNAGRIAPPPPPGMAAPTMPSAAPAVSNRLQGSSPSVVRRVKLREEPVLRRKRHRPQSARARAESDRSVQAQDRALDRKLKSICRGC
jgi:hypothetical protein